MYCKQICNDAPVERTAGRQCPHAEMVRIIAITSGFANVRAEEASLQTWRRGAHGLDIARQLTVTYSSRIELLHD